ncbi:MAG: hypothetical protein LBH44_10525 [Treponema sp.]|jgi:hypothetical protein|nr:hypothetical protein [Treponema sp.]
MKTIRITILTAFCLFLYSCASGSYAAPPSEIPDFYRNDKLLSSVWENDKLVIDWQTTLAEEEKVTTVFNNSPTVSFQMGGQTFLRVDGLLGSAEEINSYITELITHYHSDHISLAVVKQCLREGSFDRLVGPYPLLEESRNNVFYELDGNKLTNSLQKDHILDVAFDKEPLNLRFGVIGDFYYSCFDIAENVKVELFKYQKPHNQNTDGLIYRISHKGVSYLLFGDFDNPAGIENLLDAAMSVEAERENKLFSTLKADVVKWPHHAHKFNQRFDDLVIKMNAIIDPYFIVWERHHTQEGFREYIRRFEFNNKFLCSDDFEINFISLEMLNARRLLRVAISPCEVFS